MYSEASFLLEKKTLQGNTGLPVATRNTVTNISDNNKEII